MFPLIKTHQMQNLLNQLNNVKRAINSIRQNMNYDALKIKQSREKVD